MSWPADVPLLADKSAWARVGAYPDAWRASLAREQIVICSIVALELLCSARGANDVAELDGELGGLRELPVSRTTLGSARAAMVELAGRGADGYHRVPPQDAIIAACAAEHGCAVLHYDARYDRLGEVLGFASIWAAPRGSL